MKITIKFTFKGGRGWVNGKILHHGHQISPFSYKTGDAPLPPFDLDKELYLISINGVSPPDGTTVEISEPTNPQTPDEIGEGPIFKGYVLNLKNSLA